MQAAIAVSADGLTWVLVNATTDVRRQLEMLPLPNSDGSRATPVSAVLLTDANIDHAAGLLEFRQAQTLRIFSTAAVRDALAGANTVFAPLERGGRSWTVFESGAVAADVPAVVPDLRVTAIDVPGLMPSYAGADERPGAATAYCFESSVGTHRARVLYAPVFLRTSQALIDAADTCDAIFLDGSFWSDDELASLGLGTRSARDMGHAPVGALDGWLREMHGHAAAGHRYCTHINNSNPVLDPRSAAAHALRDAGFSTAIEGTEIVLDGTG
jgi:pyrroloquinoline quinone biosynthesis protein B